MITQEQIPQEVIDTVYERHDLDLSDLSQGDLLKIITAAINAWPGIEIVDVYEDANGDRPPDYTRLELTLTKGGKK
jgi:hypothetical protein